MIQLQGVIIISAYTAIVTYLILKLVSLITDVRASEENEDVGLDMSEHNRVTVYKQNYCIALKKRMHFFW